MGCRLVKRQADGGLLWGVVVETEAYSQDDPACHGYRRRSPQNETLFGEPGRFYVYVSYGIHHCVNVVTDRADWANGVLLRAVALPDEPERIAAGPGLLARRFGLDRCDDSRPVTGSERNRWASSSTAAKSSRENEARSSTCRCGQPLMTTTPAMAPSTVPSVACDRPELVC